MNQLQKTCQCHSCSLLHDLDKAIYYLWWHFGPELPVIALQAGYYEAEKMVNDTLKGGSSHGEIA